MDEVIKMTYIYIYYYIVVVVGGVESVDNSKKSSKYKGFRCG